jgi:hypothetical protein
LRPPALEILTPCLPDLIASFPLEDLCASFPCYGLTPFRRADKPLLTIARMSLESFIQKVGSTALFRNKKTEAVARPVLREPVRLPYGPFRFKTQLPKSRSYSVLISSDLKTWNPISKGITSNEAFEFVDSDAVKVSYRFYRLSISETPSVNALGFVTVTLPPGFSMIANPLDGPSNTVGELFKDWPDGTTLNKFDTRFFKLAENGVKFKKWTNPGEKLALGEGAIFFNPTSDYKSITFVGQVTQGNLSVPIPSGFSIRSSLVPQPGSLEDLGFPMANGDVIHLFDRDRQKYILHPYEGDKWTAGPPVISLAESFWVAKTEPGNWSRNLIIRD